MNWIVAYLSIITSLCLGGKLKLKSENPPFAPSCGYYKAHSSEFLVPSVNRTNTYAERPDGAEAKWRQPWVTYIHCTLRLQIVQGFGFFFHLAKENRNRKKRRSKRLMRRQGAQESSFETRSERGLESETQQFEDEEKPSKAQKTPWKQPAGRWPVTASLGEIIREDEIDR